jgi:hypothetical protein
VLCIGFYIFRAIFLGSQEIGKYEFHFNTFFLLVSLALFVLAYAMPVYAWLLLLGYQGFSGVSFFSAYRIWFYSFMGRYLPGKVGVFLIRAELSKEYSIPGSVVANIAVAEVCLFVAASIFLSMPLILLHYAEFLWPAVFSLCISGIVILLLQNKSLVSFLGHLSPRLSRFKTLSLSPSSAVRVLFIYMGFWLVMGLSFVAFLHSFVSVDPWRIGEIIAGYMLAFCGGMLAVFTPSGLGVREILLAKLLQPLYDVEIAYVISVATRLWSTVFEGIFVLVIWTVRRIVFQAGRSSPA